MPIKSTPSEREGGYEDERKERPAGTELQAVPADYADASTSEVQNAQRVALIGMVD
jgi:hypothetical protein